MLTFERPMGAVSDMKEMEYIAALHQTSSNLKDNFINASVGASDVKNYLMSRHGLKLEKDDVRRIIFQIFGGGDGENDCIDICEMLSLLIIPTLLKVSQKGSDCEVKTTKTADDFPTTWEYDEYLRVNEETEQLSPPFEIIGDVLRSILIEATGSPEPPVLNPDLLKKIFAAYGELGLIYNNELVDKMIMAAMDTNEYTDEESRISPRLDTKSFTRALTSDIYLYNVENEHKFSTHYDDVFVASSQKKNGIEIKTHSIDRIFTLPHIDFMADSFGNASHVMLVWLGFFLTYFCYMGTLKPLPVCGMDTFGCGLAKEIVRWISVILVMGIIGIPYIILLNIGNNTSNKNSICEILVGIITIGMLLLVPKFLEVDFYFFHTKTTDEFTQGLTWLLVFIASILFLLQTRNLIGKLISSERLRSSKSLATIFTSSTVMSEYRIKQSATIKVNQMIRNAYNLHVSEKRYKQNPNLRMKKYSEKPSSSHVLTNFTASMEKTESCGGFFWAWKEFWSGRLEGREGIMLHTRLLAGVFVQFIFAIVVLAFGVYIFKIVIGEFYPQGENPPVNDFCYASFSPNNCYFPQAESGVYLGFAICAKVYLSSEECIGIMQPVSNVTTIHADYCAMIDNFLSTQSSLAAEALNSTYVEKYSNEYYGVSMPFVLNNICNEPGLYSPKPDQDLWAITIDSNMTNYCVSNTNFCLPVPIYHDGETLEWEGICMIGMRGILPFQFDGTRCHNYAEISALLTTRNEMTQSVGLPHDIDYMPKKWMLILTATIALIVCFTVAMSTFLVYIPSTVASILKFRSGVFPSLRCNDFSAFRVNLHNVTFVLGAMVWGVVFSSSYIMVIVAGVVFLSVYQLTRAIVVKVIQVTLGLTITILLKMLVVKCVGNLTYTGFYRKRPITANIFSLGMEVWHMAVTLGIVGARLFKMILTAGLYAGRIDTPVLSREIFMNMDKFPNMFLQDILVTEAHRHPYIERLGVMYMMKLRYGDQFARLSGSIWRLLFIFALMPWMQKYRILDDIAFDEKDLINKLAYASRTEDENTQLENVTTLKRKNEIY